MSLMAEDTNRISETWRQDWPTSLSNSYTDNVHGGEGTERPRPIVCPHSEITVLTQKNCWCETGGAAAKKNYHWNFSPLCTVEGVTKGPTSRKTEERYLFFTGGGRVWRMQTVKGKTYLHRLKHRLTGFLNICFRTVRIYKAAKRAELTGWWLVALAFPTLLSPGFLVPSQSWPYPVFTRLPHHLAAIPPGPQFLPSVCMRAHHTRVDMSVHTQSHTFLFTQHSHHYVNVPTAGSNPWGPLPLWAALTSWSKTEPQVRLPQVFWPWPKISRFPTGAPSSFQGRAGLRNRVLGPIPQYGKTERKENVQDTK